MSPTMQGPTQKPQSFDKELSTFGNIYFESLNRSLRAAGRAVGPCENQGRH